MVYIEIKYVVLINSFLPLHTKEIIYWHMMSKYIQIYLSKIFPKKYQLSTQAESITISTKEIIYWNNIIHTISFIKNTFKRYSFSTKVITSTIFYLAFIRSKSTEILF